MEYFKYIEGFEDYMISSTGRVYSLKNNKYLKIGTFNTGYYRAVLRKQGKQYHKLVYRLVAQAFIPNPDNKLDVNHKDGDKANNDLSNLEWNTRLENIQHAFKTGLNKRSPNAGIPKIPVSVYDYKTKEFKSTHPSLKDAAREYGIFYQNIRHVLTGRCRQASGLTFSKV